MGRFIMPIRKSGRIPSSEITDEHIYLRRREFMRIAGGAAMAAAAAPWLAGCSSPSSAAEQGGGGAFAAAQTPLTGYKARAVATDEALNTFDEITGYNNFYEFGTGKSDPQALRRDDEDQPLDDQSRRPLQQAGRVSASTI